jgi:hypothetical protein
MNEAREVIADLAYRLPKRAYRLDSSSGPIPTFASSSSQARGQMSESKDH